LCVIFIGMTVIKKFDRSDKNCLDPISCGCPLHNKEEPYDGWFRRHWSNGNLRYEWKNKSYKRDDGQIIRYRADGVSKGWYSNGQLKQIKTWKDGKPDGLVTTWYENGEKEDEGTYKNSILTGLYTTWYRNGQKQYEGYSDNSSVHNQDNGLATTWYENGKKKSEVIYKDGEVISRKRWKE